MSLKKNSFRLSVNFPLMMPISSSSTEINKKQLVVAFLDEQWVIILKWPHHANRHSHYSMPERKKKKQLRFQNQAMKNTLDVQLFAILTDITVS